MAIVAGDDAEQLRRCLPTVAELRPELHVLATHDAGEIELAIADTLGPFSSGALPWRRVVAEPFVDYGAARSRVLQLAGEGSADWVLMLDADMTCTVHEGLRAWLGSDPLPDVNAWQVEIVERGVRYRLPLLTRRKAGGRYVGRTHEALAIEGEQYPLSGLEIEHHADGTHREGKLERDLELLADDVAAGDPRATYYAAQAYRDLGDTEQAIELYRRRASMGGWQEEAWHAEYRAAQLAGDVDGLLLAYRRRPWRPEPLAAAAQLVRELHNGAGDTLFLEP